MPNSFRYFLLSGVVTKCDGITLCCIEYSASLELCKDTGIAGMRLSDLDPLIPLSTLKEELLKLPRGYSFYEQEVVEFLSKRRWPDSDRRIDRTTFWRWRNDNEIDHQKVFSRLDILKLCQICDHYRVDGTRKEYLDIVKKEKKEYLDIVPNTKQVVMNR